MNRMYRQLKEREVSIMKLENKNVEITEKKELSDQEVNLYDNCGQDKYRCHNDCIIPYTSFLNRNL